jgi:hypothetical protein
MALYHVHASVISKGKSPGGSTGFAQYLAREQTDQARQYARYVHRDGRVDIDLVAKGHEALPSWARDGAHFFLMADRHERKGATIARCYEIALPRELSPDARLELAADLRSTFFMQYPHTWAMHNPIDKRGQEHPHMHLMLSERRPTDDSERSPKQYFSRAATVDQDPATHGVRKDRSWQGPARLHELRAGVATLTNAALEREGFGNVAVSHASLRAQGHERQARIYTTRQNRQAVEAQRDILHREYHPWENDMNVLTWHRQKEREGIRDLSRDAMVDHVRDRFWQHDQSLVRVRERAQSIERTMDWEYSRTGRERRPVQTLERTPTRERTYDAALARITRRLGHSLGHGREDTMGHGLQADLKSHDHEQERGMGY